MELTKFCVELVWMLCFFVELVWILKFGFIPTFGLILGLIVGWFYVVFLGMFCAVFVACFVASIGRILWPVEKGCSGMVSGQNDMYRSCQGALWHAVAWKPHYCVVGLKIEALGYAIVWVST